MALVDMNGNSERKLRRRKFVASIKGVVVKWTPSGFSLSIGILWAFR